MFELTRRNGTEITLPDLIRRFWDVEPSLRSWATTFQPSVDINETETEFKIVAECPGMKKEEFTITLEGTTLTLTGEKKEETECKTESAYQCERRFGKFTRSFTLPAKVDAKTIGAVYKDGVLEITLPKLPEAQPQKIAINAQ